MGGGEEGGGGEEMAEYGCEGGLGRGWNGGAGGVGCIGTGDHEKV